MNTAFKNLYVSFINQEVLLYELLKEILYITFGTFRLEQEVYMHGKKEKWEIRS